MKKKVLNLLNKMKPLMKRRVPRIALIVVLCGVVTFLLISALKPDSTPAAENQVVTVQRGDLTVDISAAGNLALSVTEDLAFEISGTVEEILVEDGDSVEEGQLLVKLDTSEWERELTNLGVDLIQAEINLDNAELALDQAEEKLSDLSGSDRAVQLQEIDVLELKLELAEARFEEAKEAVEDALENSPEITAPFDGFITKVNVSGGDEVTKGTVAVTLADPNKFEADILVSEMDIFQIELGGEALVEVDAVEGLSLRAEVTHIAPTATIQSGVVNYEVKVELQSLEEAMQEQQQARQEAMPDISSGEALERIQQAIDEGRITQEQAEEMMEQMQQRQGEQQDQMSAMIPENFQLREGLTVTVSLIVDEASDVLLVLNSAITTRGWQSYVQVLSPDGTIEERAITTGISDWQYTEVTSGLSEGEEVIVPQGTTTSTTSEGTWEEGRPGGMMMPGMGGFGM
jgi:RND family efflux transporter MFP subunit